MSVDEKLILFQSKIFFSLKPERYNVVVRAPLSQLHNDKSSKRRNGALTVVFVPLDGKNSSVPLGLQVVT